MYNPRRRAKIDTPQFDSDYVRWEVIMKRIVFPLAILLCIAAYLIFVLAEKPVPPATEMETTAEPTSLEPTKENTVPEPVPVVDQPIEEPERGIRGVVQRVDGGTTVEGATVKVSTRKEGYPKAETTTDAEGRFVLDPETTGEFSFKVTHHTLVSERHSYRAIFFEDDPGPDLVIGMVSGGVVSGRVYDANTDAGIAGVEIGMNWNRRPGVKTDAEGLYKISGIRDGEQRLHIAHAKGYIDSPKNADGIHVSVVAGKEVSNVDIGLQPGVFATISGKVVDDQGNSVEGANIMAVSRERSLMNAESSKGKSDSDGTFFLEELQLAGGFYVTASTDASVSAEAGPLTLTNSGIQDLELILRPYGSISGIVVDETTGAAVKEPSFAVDSMYRRFGVNSIGGNSVNLDENGHFKLTNLPPGPYGLFIDATPNVHTTGIVEPLITIELEHGQHIKDVRLAIDHDRFRRSADSFAEMDLNPRPVEKPDEPKVGKVLGQVLHAHTGEAVTSFHLLARHKYMGESRSSQSIHDAEGRFTVEAKKGQTLSMEIESDGFVPFVEEVQGGIGEQSEKHITIRLEPGAIVDGAVVDTLGNSITGAQVFIEVDPGLIPRDHPVKTAGAVSDTNGLFRLDTLPKNVSRVFAKHPAYAVGWADVSPTGSIATPLTIVLREGGIIEGSVRKSGLPLPDLNVMVIDENRENLKLSTNRTDQNGNFRLEHIPPGNYTLYTYIERNRSQFVDAEVAEGMVTEVLVDFGGTGNTLKGSVLLNGETPFTFSVRVEIETMYGTDKLNTGMMQAGEYALTDLPLGSAKVHVSARMKDGTTAKESVTIPIVGGTLRQDFDLRSGVTAPLN
jgi:hypothetical protein